MTVQVDAAEKGPIQRKVVTDAVLYPRDQAAIVPKVVSSIKKWYVDKGSHVKAGQLLGELENQDLTGAAMKSQGGYAQAEVTYQMQIAEERAGLEVRQANAGFGAEVLRRPRGAVQGRRGFGEGPGRRFRRLVLRRRIRTTSRKNNMT